MIILSYAGFYLHSLSLSEDKCSQNDHLVLERSQLPQIYEVMILSAVSFINLNEIMGRSFLAKVGCAIASSCCMPWLESNCWISPELLDQAAWSLWNCMSVCLLLELTLPKVPGKGLYLISRNRSHEGKKREEVYLPILTLPKTKALSQKLIFWLFVWAHA